MNDRRTRIQEVGSPRPRVGGFRDIPSTPTCPPHPPQPHLPAHLLLLLIGAIVDVNNIEEEIWALEHFLQRRTLAFGTQVTPCPHGHNSPTSVLDSGNLPVGAPDPMLRKSLLVSHPASPRPHSPSWVQSGRTGAGMVGGCKRGWYGPRMGVGSSEHSP